MSRQSLVVLAGVAMLALLAAGCGGSEDNLTKAEFIKQSDAICKEGSGEITSGYKAFAKAHGLKEGEFPSQAQGYELGEDVYLPSIEKRVEAIRDLNPPSADESEVEAILVAMEDGAAAARKNIKVLFELEKNPFEESKSLSKAYGFKICGTS